MLAHQDLDKQALTRDRKRYLRLQDKVNEIKMMFESIDESPPSSRADFSRAASTPQLISNEPSSHGLGKH